MGYYFRRVVDEKGRYYIDFPIARFKCRRKGSNIKSSHKTFSLLPYQLVPYSKYSIPFTIEVLEVRYNGSMSVHQLQNYIADLTACDEGYIELSSARVYSFKALIKQAITKVLACQEYHHQFRIQQPAETAQIISFLQFCSQFSCFKLHPPIRGPCALAVDFYFNSGGYWNNGYFLFGTPSQFRS